MTNPINPDQLAQARALVDAVDANPKGYDTQVRAAAEVIASLPDHIIDADKVRGMVKAYRSWEGDANAEGTENALGRALAYRSIAQSLEALLPAPPRPTLAELIERGCNPKDFRWMQCEVKGDDRRAVITEVDGVAYMLIDDGVNFWRANEMITPLPDLPRLVWPSATPTEQAPPPSGAFSYQEDE